jgi:hypothetical protein
MWSGAWDIMVDIVKQIHFQALSTVRLRMFQILSQVT